MLFLETVKTGLIVCSEKINSVTPKGLYITGVIKPTVLYTLPAH